jgi:alpha-tubulin suppressor-like RCC1 family protein
MSNTLDRRSLLKRLTTMAASPLLLGSFLSLVAVGCGPGTESPTAPTAGSQLVASSATLSFRQISGGLFHTCGVATDDRAYCWGQNVNGQLGDGTTTSRARPTPVAGGHFFILVSAGAGYSCGITTQNRAYCWGQNTTGQLGDGTTTDRLRPVAVASSKRFSQVRSGYFHTCAVDPFNAAFCWGHNSNGQLGDNSKISRLTPVRVRGGLAFRRVFTAGFHSCGATLDNRGYCWGRNEDGQLGDGTTIQKLKPTLIAGNHRFTQVFVGAAHGGGWSSNSCGLTSDQRAYCWGDNRLGQIGDGTSGWNLIRTSPVAVLGGLQFSGLNTSGVATCGVTTANRAYCWGSDGNFQVGDGNSTAEEYTTPNAVTGGLQFRAITTGTLHTCAITTLNAAYCWGNNFEGQLGIGTFDSGAGFTAKSSPLAVVAP